MAEMSALFPTETKVESPNPSALAYSMIASPRAPLWDRKPTRPSGGASGAKVALRRTARSVFTIPRQFGPMRRIPVARQSRTSFACRARPSAPVSAKPEEITTSARTPFRPHCSVAWRTRPAGTAMTARSTGPGIASTLGYAGTHCTTSAAGFTG